MISFRQTFLRSKCVRPDTFAGWVFFLSLIFGFEVSNLWATEKVYSPIVQKGEWELEARGSRDFDGRDDKDKAIKQKYALGYGVTELWFTEIYGEFEQEAQSHESNATSIEWENRFQLTQQGQYFFPS